MSVSAELESARRTSSLVTQCVALLLLVGLAVACATGAPPLLRVPLSLVVVGLVPGAAVVALIRLPPSATSVSVVLGMSLALSVLLAQVLVWIDRLTLANAVTAMLVVFGGPLVFAIRRDLAEGRV
jgi:hypothetical protein